jgi:hypothetical protein
MGAGQTLGKNAIAKNLRGLRDAHDRGFLKNEDIAGPAAELNASVLAHLPLCVTSGNELADIFHHQCFHWIGMDLGRDCNASDFGTVQAPAALCVVG